MEAKAWCLKENKKAILRKKERAMMRAMCDQKDDCRTDGHVGVEGNYRLVSNSKWS